MRLREAREHLRHSDPVIRQLIDAHPDFDPKAWLTGLPKLDTLGALIFQIIGQQLSVQASRLLDRLQQQFGGRLPTADPVLASDPETLRATGLARRC